MRPAGKLSAAIEILDDFAARRTPLKTAIADWGRNNRYAGAKDRAWISGLCLDALRRRNSLAAAMGADPDAVTGRALVLAAFRFLWRTPMDALADIAAEEPHGPGALTSVESDMLSVCEQGFTPTIPAKAGIQQKEDLDPRWSLSSGRPAASAGGGDGRVENASNHIRGDFPEWMAAHIERAFGDRTVPAMRAFAERADVYLRINTLKTTPEKALAALKPVKAEAVPVLTTAARIAAPDPAEKAPAVTVIPAFNKGWVEVQDLGSQIAAAAAGDVKSAQVLDYCAGGGGKTLALAAMMENTGQLYAYDRDARRLKPLYHRAKRAGVRNLQVRSPAGGEGLDDLAGRMDVVFVDAPCTGAGTWRRHPDTKWRLTPQQLQRRMDEQDAVLREAARFVKPGGRMIWVTCSFLMEENEDRLAAFSGAHPDFTQTPALDAIRASGLVGDDGAALLESCETPEGAIRLAPDVLRADGFFIATLLRTEQEDRHDR